jgi:hypothetical protein
MTTRDEMIEAATSHIRERVGCQTVTGMPTVGCTHYQLCSCHVAACAAIEAVAPMIRAAVLEEAAQVARYQIANYPLRTMLTDPDHADRVAVAIRALIGEEKP